MMPRINMTSPIGKRSVTNFIITSLTENAAMPATSARIPRRLAEDTGDTGASAAGNAHVAGQGRALVATIDDEVMPLGLARDGGLDRGIEHVVGLGGAQRRAQVGGVFLAETHEERASAGDPHAVAGFA